MDRSKAGSPSRLLCLGLAAALLVSLAVGAHAASLWQDGQYSIISDTKASKVGYLVTLISVERTQASQSTEVTTCKDTSIK